MSNEFEKFGQKSRETTQEQNSLSEKPEGDLEISYEELQKKIEQANTEVETEQAEVVANAGTRIENVPASSGLTEEKASEIYEQGSFAEKVNTAKEQITELGAQTKTQIENLSSQLKDEKEGKQKYESPREYSKEKIPEERRVLAKKISELRRDKFQSDKELEAKIDGLLKEAETGKLAVEEATKQIQASTERLLQLKEGLISHVVNFREIRKLEEQVDSQKISQEKFDEQYRNAQELISNLEAQKNDRSKLEQAKGLLDEFYENKEKEWTDYEKEERGRPIKNVLEKYNVTMVHAFTPRGGPEENTLIRSDISWEEKLKIVLAFEPTISTSAISSEQQGMWANMGVLLNGGRVEAAAGHDAGTRAKSGGKREVSYNSSATYDFSAGKIKTIEQQLQETMSYHHKGDFMNYNEIVVSNPEVAGFFIKVKEDDSIDDIGVPSEEVFSAVEKLGLPMFAIKNGEAYRIDPSATEEILVDRFRQQYKTVLKLGEKVTPVELAALPSVVGKEKKEQIAAELMEDSPFKLNMAEARFTDSRNAGREAYVGANFSTLDKLENIPTEMYQSGGPYENQPELVGKQVKLLSEVKSPIATYRLLSFEGKLYNQSINKRTRERATYEKLSHILEEGNLLTGVDYHIINNYGTGETPKPINSTGAYIEKMRISIDTFQNQLKEAREKQRENSADWAQHSLREAAFHLYGFAEEAMQRGDTESQETANRLAAEILSQEEYQNTVSRRIGPNGEFRVTKEDL